MRREIWTVGDAAVRPAGEQDECFYCHEKVGEQHKPDCVMRQRTVLVRCTFETVMECPESWDDAMLVWQRTGEGSYCASNIISDLDRLYDAEESGRCLCGNLHMSVVREATLEDEDRHGVKVEECES